MATKLRSLSTSLFTKIVLFILFCGCVFTVFSGVVRVVAAAEKNNLPLVSVVYADYRNTWDFRNAGRNIVNALFMQKSPEEWLRHNDCVPTPYYYRAEYPDGQVVTNAPVNNGDYFKTLQHYEVYRTAEDGSWDRLDGSDMDYIRYPNVIQPYYSQVQEYNVYVEERPFGVTVRSSTNTISMDSTPTAPEYADSLAPEDADSLAPTEPVVPEACPIVTVYYAYDDAGMAQFDTFWYNCRYYFLGQFGLLGGLGLAGLACAVWLMIVCGRKPADRELHLLAVDRAWTEVALVGVWGVAALCMVGAIFGIAGTDIIEALERETLMLSVWAGLATFGCGLALLATLSLLRKTKARQFIRGSFTFLCLHLCIWVPCKALWNIARACFDERAFKTTPLTLSLFRRQRMLLCIFGGWLVFLMFFGLMVNEAAFCIGIFVTLLLFAPLVWWHFSGSNKTYQAINEGFNQTVAEQVRSESTKTALITNVSHDLKTPLTSIITYIDLLEKEELNDAARDYVTVLAEKSQRLKAMVSDLFDLAKSSSGNIPLDLETLDLKRLLEQTLADMKDRVDESGLQLKTSFPEGEVFIYSDGKKLYRVFQNIIGNALKYSLNGTRVYVSLDGDAGYATAVIKNTAGYEMDFTADEVLQRFVRGDKARSGEGSGLGLSIAESFTEACGGSFKLEIDGDLFKVTARFPLAAPGAAPSNV